MVGYAAGDGGEVWVCGGEEVEGYVWGEDVGGRGEARRVGRWDWSVRRAGEDVVLVRC